MEYDGKVNIQLEHSLDNFEPPSYFHRGDILIKSLHSGAYSIDEGSVNHENYVKLKNLARDNGNYKMKATIKTSDGKANYFNTFVKAVRKDFIFFFFLLNVLPLNLGEIFFFFFSVHY